MQLSVHIESIIESITDETRFNLAYPIAPILKQILSNMRTGKAQYKLTMIPQAVNDDGINMIL